MAGNPEIVVDFVARTKGLQKAAGDVSGMGSKIGRGFKRALIPAVAALGAVGLATRAVVKEASDLNESQNAVNVTFGKGAKVINEFAREGAKFGLSMNEVNASVVPIGASLQNYGLSATAAAKTSVELTKRAADMASVFNTSVPDALQAVQAGLRGEADPLERYGVSLTEAQLKTFALAEGIHKGTGELTAHEKALARVGLIMEQTNRTAGDFRNTSDGLANAQRIISASWKNIQAQAGKVLLPTLARAASGVADFLAKFSEARGAGAKFRVVVDSVKNIGTELYNALRSAIGKIDWGGIWSQARGLADGLTKALGKVDWSVVGATIGRGIARAVGLAGSGIKVAADRLLAIFREVDWTAVGRAAGPGLATAVAVAISTALDPSFWVKNWDVTLAIAATVFGGAIGKVAGKLAAPLVRLGGDFVVALAAAIEARAPLLGEAVFRLFLAIPGVVARAGAIILAPVRALFGRLGSLATFTVKVLGVTAVINAVVGMGRAVVSAVTSAWNSVKSATSSAWNAVRNATVTAWNAIRGAIAAAIGAIRGVVSSGFNAIVGVVRSAIGSLVGAIRAGAGRAGAAAAAIVAAVKGAFAGAGRWLYQAGVDAVMGLVHGIESVASLPGRALHAITSRLPHTPWGSTAWEAMSAVGNQAGWGLAAGITAAAPASEKAAKAMVKRAFEAAKAAASAQAGTLAAMLTRAFEARQGAARTPAEAQLAALQAGHEEAARNQALADAQAQVNAATTDEERLSAQRAYQEAAYAIQVAGLEKQAATERVELEGQQELQKTAFEKRLAALQTYLGSSHATAKGATVRINKLLRDFGLDIANIGSLLGPSMAKAINASIPAAVKAARRLGQAVYDAVKHELKISSPSRVMEDAGRNVVLGFARGINRNVGLAAQAMGSLSASTAGGGFGLLEAQAGPVEVRVFIGNQELRGLVRTEIVESNTGLARSLLAGGRR